MLTLTKIYAVKTGQPRVIMGKFTLKLADLLLTVSIKKGNSMAIPRDDYTLRTIVCTYPILWAVYDWERYYERAWWI
jgi:hypothetical protein